jgi:UDP-N-acetylglucosamine 2-epimerase
MVIANIIGTRPQYIKAALISKELKSRGITELLIDTGQHYDYNMAGIFAEEFKLNVYNLGVCHNNSIQQISEIISCLNSYLSSKKIDVGIVYGDTNSALSAAITLKKLGIPIAHVEAGLRSYDDRMQEEHNRIMIDHISDLLFAPTTTSVKNLSREGMCKGIYNVGDIMYDSIIASNIVCKEPCDYILATIHRAENTNDIENIISILHGFALSRKRIMFPMHPRIKKAIENMKIEMPYNVDVIEPQNYSSMLKLIAEAERVITDSGGIQKESYILGTPCITIRESTEWTETLRDGMNKLCPINTIAIANMLTGKRNKKTPQKYYGDGKAYMKIIDIIEREYA